MNHYINKLHQIASKETRVIIGLMSGTSVDGLDIALCKITGNGTDTDIELIQFETANYVNDYKEEIQSIFSKKEVDLEKLCLLNAWVGTQHAILVLDKLKKWNIPTSDIDLIASHGQTIYHAPKSLHQQIKFDNATLQIGDGDHIAVKTGIITISDFRQKNIAEGGEGAPLAVYGDYYLFSKPNENRVMLNIGGIANFTYLDDSTEANLMFSTDVGPGNTIMDAYIKANFINLNFDKDASIAKTGFVNDILLNELLNHSFFSLDFPKTTGPELFNLDYLQAAQAKSKTINISHEDVMATLCKFSADAIVMAINKSISKKEFTIYISGGGMHNPLLIQFIKEGLSKNEIKNTSDLGINPDAKEAILFAILANECVSGKAINLGAKTPSTLMGKISLP